MSVWLVIPSARPVPDVNSIVAEWLWMGYCVALQRDPGKGPGIAATAVFERPYSGYAEAVNWLAKTIIDADDSAKWLVTGGDDIEPDLSRRAEIIANECTDHFDGTFGVMQPTGDRWGEDEPFNRSHWPDAPAYIDRVCGSPWMGREFCQRMYAGNGPLWPEFTHMFVDEHLQQVAQKLGILWQRRDLTHFHHHVHRDGNGQVPEFLKNAYSSAHWKEAKAIFDRLKDNGFAEAEAA